MKLQVDFLYIVFPNNDPLATEILLITNIQGRDFEGISVQEVHDPNEDWDNDIDLFNDPGYWGIKELGHKDKFPEYFL